MARARAGEGACGISPRLAARGRRLDRGARARAARGAFAGRVVSRAGARGDRSHRQARVATAEHRLQDADNSRPAHALGLVLVAWLAVVQLAADPRAAGDPLLRGRARALSPRPARPLARLLADGRARKADLRERTRMADRSWFRAARVSRPRADCCIGSAREVAVAAAAPRRSPPSPKRHP